MTHQVIFYIIIAVIVVDFIYSGILDSLNAKARSKPIPDKLKGIYHEEKYQKQQKYAKENHSFSTISKAVSFIALLLMFLLSGFQYVHELAFSISDNIYLNTLLFFGIIMLASEVMGIPFSYYDTFVIEEKYGFNKVTKKIFILDKIKGLLLTSILGGGILSAILWFYLFAGADFWIYAWGLISFISLFFLMFYSNLIVPLFNKQTPLEDGELKSKINEFCTKAGFTLKNVYVIDGSKRSTKANAYFTGLGKKKRIVLYDTLINDLSPDEIVAVLAHEIGHYKKKHTLTGLISSIVQTGFMLWLLSLFINKIEFTQAIVPNAEQVLFHIGLISFGILYDPISTITGIIGNYFSRKNEYQADAYAASFNLGKHLISGLKNLTSKSLGNLTPHPVYVFVNYSHPDLLQRINAIEKLEK